jgi:hypothetical protein
MPKAILSVFLCIAAPLLAIGALGAQDLKISYRTESKTLTTSKGAQVEYHSARCMLTKNDKEKKDTLVDYGDFSVFEIDHKKKTIGKTTLEDIQKAMDLVAAKMEEMSDRDGATAQAMKDLFGGEDAAVTVTSAGTEQVAGRDCEKWEIALDKFSAMISADKSLAPPASPDALEMAKRLKGGALLANPALGRTFGRFFDAMNSVEGVQLKSEVVMPIGPMTIRSFKEATEVEVGPLPASLFELPKGYKQEDAGKKMLAGLGKKLGKR